METKLMIWSHPTQCLFGSQKCDSVHINDILFA